MLQIAFATLRSQPRRYLAPIVAAAIGVAFAATTLIGSDSFQAAIQQQIKGSLNGYDVVGMPTGEITTEQSSQQVIDGLRNLPESEKVKPVYSTAGTVGEKSPQWLGIETIPDDNSGGLRVEEGQWPTANDQVAITQALARDLKVSVGSTVPVNIVSFTQEPNADPGNDAEPQSHEKTFAVVGIINSQGAGITGGMSSTGYITDQAFQELTGNMPPSRILMTVADGYTPEQLKKVASDFTQLASFKTTDESIQENFQSFKEGFIILEGLFLAFAVIALFVASLVIANTFAVLIARRSQQTALSRCVGATKSQIFKANIVESIVVAIFGGVVGVALGAALVAVGLLIAKQYVSLPLEFAMSPRSAIFPFLMGLVVTVVASIIPALRATRTSPLAALRSVGANATRVVSLPLAIGSSIMLALGLAMILFGAFNTKLNFDDNGASMKFLALLGIVMVGTMLSFLAVLVGARALVPILGRAIGAPMRRLGVPPEMAVENSVRDPKRAAITVSALMVGLGLISTVIVAGSLAQTSLVETVNKKFPLDVAVSGPAGWDTPSVKSMLSNVNGIENTVYVPYKTVTAKITMKNNTDPNTVDQQLHIVKVELLPVSDDDPAQMGTQVNGTNNEFVDYQNIQVFNWTKDAASALRDSEQFTFSEQIGLSSRLVTDETGTSSVTAGGKTSDVAYKKIPNLLDAAEAALAHPDIYAQLEGEENTVALMKAKADADTSETFSDIKKVADNVDGANLEGGLALSNIFNKIINGVMLFVTALLAVSMIIAIIGVGNTLSLSVLERSQEIGLLRALGLTKRQTRLMIIAEAIVLALLAILLGIGLGMLYGWAGTKTLFAGQIEVSLAFPWLKLAGLAAAAIVAGIAASLMPARNATKIAPVEALRAD